MSEEAPPIDAWLRELGLEVVGLELDELDALLTPHHGRGPD